MLYILCQRPERAFLISTPQEKAFIETDSQLCQRPKWAFLFLRQQLLYLHISCNVSTPLTNFFISTLSEQMYDEIFGDLCQRPERAFLFLHSGLSAGTWLRLAVSTP